MLVSYNPTSSSGIAALPLSEVETAKFKAADLDKDQVLSAHEVASLFYPALRHIQFPSSDSLFQIVFSTNAIRLKQIIVFKLGRFLPSFLHFVFFELLFLGSSGSPWSCCCHHYDCCRVLILQHSQCCSQKKPVCHLKWNDVMMLSVAGCNMLFDLYSSAIGCLARRRTQQFWKWLCKTPWRWKTKMEMES